MTGDATVGVPVIAIDGPSASGKGTIAANVARSLGFHHLDSGALYRLVALAALRSRASLEDGDGLAALAKGLEVEMRGGDTLLSGTVVNEDMRSEDCSRAASQVAAVPAVRSALIGRQRAFRKPPGLVADGRDMGSVVFPDAALKIYLTAMPQARAERRYKQLMENGIDANMRAILQDIAERDARDSARSVAPLQITRDALVVDSTGLSIAQVTAQVLSLWQGRAKR